MDLMAGEAHLRSKRELIEKFIRENLPDIDDTDDIPEEFERYWTKEQQEAFSKLCQDENLSDDKVERVISDYMFSGRDPLLDELHELRKGEKPTLLERRKTGTRILQKIKNFIDTFINGIGE